MKTNRLIAVLALAAVLSASPALAQGRGGGSHGGGHSSSSSSRGGGSSRLGGGGFARATTAARRGLFLSGRHCLQLYLLL